MYTAYICYRAAADSHDPHVSDCHGPGSSMTANRTQTCYPNRCEMKQTGSKLFDQMNRRKHFLPIQPVCTCEHYLHRTNSLDLTEQEVQKLQDTRRRTRRMRTQQIISRAPNTRCGVRASLRAMIESSHPNVVSVLFLFVYILTFHILLHQNPSQNLLGLVSVCERCFAQISSVSYGRTFLCNAPRFFDRFPLPQLGWNRIPQITRKYNTREKHDSFQWLAAKN